MMVCESERCVSSPIPSTPSPPSLHPQTQPPFSASEWPHRSSSDQCFSCGSFGHWAKECPNKTPKKLQPGSSSSSSMNDFNLLLIRCPCGRGVCPVRTSGTEKNPGRKFYTCPAYKSLDGCNFFRWCDKLSNLRAPTCPCGAGVCSLNSEAIGPNAGKWYFSCRIKRSHGACRFFQWGDSQVNDLMHGRANESKEVSSPQSLCISNEVSNTGNRDLREKEDFGYEMEFESSLLESSETDPNTSLTIMHSEKDNVHDKDLVMQEVDIWAPMMGEDIHVSRVMSQFEIRCHHTEFWRQISVGMGNNLKDVICQSLSLHFRGWLGRLAFPPPHCLKDPPAVRFFCCIFPSFDPVTLPEDVEMSDTPHSPTNAETETTPPQTVGYVDQPSSNVFCETSGLENPFNSTQNNVISASIIRTYGQGLLDILELIRPTDYEIMLKVAEATFETFNCLSVDHGHFSEGVKEYIRRASELARIEGCMRKDLSPQELVEVYNGEKVRFDKISRLHADAAAAHKASDARLQAVSEKVRQIKDMLGDLENYLSIYEAKTSELQSRVNEISMDMWESKKSMDAAREEVEKHSELEKERESVMNAGKAALEKTRAALLQR